MPTADLRALAERLGLLKPCRCEGMRLYSDDPEWAGAQTEYVCECRSTGRRLPTEAEARAAIFEAGFRLTIYVGPKYVTVLAMRPAQASHGATERVAAAHGEEAVSDDLVRLALLRALGVARG